MSLTIVDGKVLWDGGGSGASTSRRRSEDGGRVARRIAKLAPGDRREMSLFVRTIVRKRDGAELTRKGRSPTSSGASRTGRSPTSRRRRF